MKHAVLCLAAIFLFTGCATIFLPKRQKVKFITDSKEATVYLDKEEIGKGTLFTERVIKDGSAKQLIIKTPGYKDNYVALVPSRRQTAYWFLQIPNPIWMVYMGFYWDALNPKCMGYQKEIQIPVQGKLVYRDPNIKYIDITSIKLNIKDKNKDIKDLYVKYRPYNLDERIQEEEADQLKRDTKAEMAAAKAAARKKNKKGKMLETEEKGIVYDDTKFSYNIYKTLKNTGFVDTVNNFFSDHNNSLYLEGSINKVYANGIYGKQGNYLKTKVFLTWYLKNNFNETIDSIVTTEMSGDFTYSYGGYSDALISACGDAIDISYLKLHTNPSFTKHLKVESDFKIKDKSLKIESPKAFISEKADAGMASVIVKSSDKHGSGFAISNDGYIITNYHVISGKKVSSLSTFTVITSSGEELEGKVVRYNKFRDIALIKVESKFEKAFRVTSSKSFKNLQDVFTIGAPKSVELGQSVSTGIISNERKTKNNNLLQLNMSVNSGNSGGPLFDDKGTLHGVIVSKAIGKNTEGISFAIPGYLIEDYLNINFK